jgi:hypothetical protein
MTAKIARPFVDSIFITLIVSMFITEGEGGVKSLETRPVRTAGGHSDTHPRNKKSRLGRLEISELRSSACVNGNCGIACDRV